MTLEPFLTNEKPVCRMCGHDTKDLKFRFCAGECVPDGSGGYHNTLSKSSVPLPHLHRTCSVCGYEWLTETHLDYQAQYLDREQANRADWMRAAAEEIVGVINNNLYPGCVVQQDAKFIDFMVATIAKHCQWIGGHQA